MRAVASRSALTVIRERSWEADFLGIVRSFAAMENHPEYEFQKRTIAHIFLQMEMTGNTMRARAQFRPGPSANPRVVDVIANIVCGTGFTGGHNMTDTMQRLFRYKAWADEELLTALAGLGGDAPITQLAIKALSHSYVVDRIFFAH